MKHKQSYKLPKNKTAEFCSLYEEVLNCYGNGNQPNILLLHNKDFLVEGARLLIEIWPHKIKVYTSNKNESIYIRD